MPTLSIQVGCYTQDNRSNQGIQSVIFDTVSGEMSHTATLYETKNPSFVTGSELGYYFVSELSQSEGAHVSFTPNPLSVPQSTLTPCENIQRAIAGDHPCHVDINTSNTLLVTSQYSSGSFCLFKIENDGKISDKHITLSVDGNGPNQNRQTQSHAHQALFLRNIDQIATVDLGADKVRFYRINSHFDGMTLELLEELSMPAGNGPRHMVFNEREDVAYVLCELSETIVVISKRDNAWCIVGEHSALPNSSTGEAAAAIKLSPDGRYLYVSCRAQSKICWFKINQDPTLIEFRGSVSSVGEFPRDFSISKNGEWLVAANQHSNDLISFKRNIETGELTFSGHRLEIGSPVCVYFG